MGAVAADSRLSRSVAAWNSFWFTPSSPLVLAAIRIVTGLIVFYTMVAYTLDLQELAGIHAWQDLEMRQEERHDFPVANVPFGWVDPNYRTPKTTAEDAYAKAYIQRWGEPPPLPYPKTAEEAASYDAYHARWGVDPRRLLTTGQPVWSVWFHVTDPFWMNVVQGCFLLSSFLFLIGCATRVTSFLTWFAVLCFIHRAPASLFGADTMLAVLLLYLMIGPSGAVLSVDHWIARWLARRRGLTLPAVSPSVSANLAIRLVQIHACIIYGSAGLSKLQGNSWWMGTAAWGTLANHEFAPMDYPIYVEVLRWLAATRWFYELTMTIGTLGTLVFEIGYPFLIWRPAFRTLWLWLAVFFHAGIGMFMGLPTFSILMLAFNLAFVSPTTVEWVLNKLSPTTWRPNSPPISGGPGGVQVSPRSLDKTQGRVKGEE